MENKVKKFNEDWCNTQIGLENSEWVAENVMGVHETVKETLLLIEADGNFVGENGDNDNPKEQELVSCIKDISQGHHLLADHYNKLTGELSSNIQSPNESETKNHERDSFDSQPNPPFLTPDKKLGMQNVEHQVVCSDLSGSSGGGISDETPKEGSESLSVSSDSDSEAYYSLPFVRSSHRSSKVRKQESVDMDTGLSEMEGLNTLTKQGRTDSNITVEEYEILLNRISEYEKQSEVANQKLQQAEDEIANLKSELQHNEAVSGKMVSLEAQLLSAMNQIKLYEAEIEQETKRSLMLQGQIIDLEAKLESEKTQVHQLEGSIAKYTTLSSDRKLEIEKLNAELQDASGNFALEKWQLEDRIMKLSEHSSFLEERNKELQIECESLADQAKKYEAGKAEIESMKISWQDDIEQMKTELCKKTAQVDNLNKNLDGLKLKNDILMAENDGVNAKLKTLIANLSARDDQIRTLEYSLRELHSENIRLTAGSESANKLTAEVRSRIHELEEELGRQAIMISDMAEEKREAIRQLCFSLDHFRCAYEQACKAYITHKQNRVVISWI